MIAVGFDFDHTLGLDHKLERTAFLDVAAQLRAGASAPRAGVPDPAQKLIDDALADFRSGRASIESAISGAFAAAVPGVNAGAAFRAFCERALELVPQHVTAVPFARELIALLDAAAVPHAILTNGWSPLQERKAEAIGYRGPVLVSGVLGMRKPSRAAFDALAARLPAGAVWYVGDEPENDCAGAESAGLSAVWFDWEARDYPAALPPPRAVIHRLADLPGVLGLSPGVQAC